MGGRPYVALHWRRTDFLQARRSQPGVLQSAAELLRHTRRLLTRHSAELVYLATDCEDEAELELLRRELGEHSVHRYVGWAADAAAAPCAAAGDGGGSGHGGGGGERRSLRERTAGQTFAANIEIAICAAAAGFLGTRSSSFSLAIADERQAIFGHAAHTAADMGLLDEDAPKDDSD